MNKVYIVVEYSCSYEGGDCMNCMYSSTDKYKACKKCIEYAMEELSTNFMRVVDLYTDYKVISISNPEKFTTDYMMKEEETAETIAAVMNLDRAIYEAIENRKHMGYYVEEDDPEDILLRQRITNYLKSKMGERK